MSTQYYDRRSSTDAPERKAALRASTDLRSLRRAARTARLSLRRHRYGVGSRIVYDVGEYGLVGVHGQLTLNDEGQLTGGHIFGVDVPGALPLVLFSFEEGGLPGSPITRLTPGTGVVETVSVSTAPVAAIITSATPAAHLVVTRHPETKEVAIVAAYLAAMPEPEVRPIEKVIDPAWLDSRSFALGEFWLGLVLFVAGFAGIIAAAGAGLAALAWVAACVAALAATITVAGLHKHDRWMAS